MDATAIQFRGSTRGAIGSHGIRLSALLSPVLLAALGLATTAVAMRRLAGGLTQPLAPWAFVGAAMIAALSAVGSRGLSHVTLFRDALSREFLTRGFGAQLIRWLSGAALVTFVAALSIPGTAVAALVGGWGIVVAEEAWAWRRLRRAGVPVERRPEAIPRPDETSASDPGATQHALELPPWIAPPAAASSSAEVLQQLTRLHAPDGTDRLSGWLQTAFEPGERTAVVHVAFCPPFAETPKITVRPTSGPASRIKPGQILTHGVRLELKLNFASRDRQRVLLEFTAESR